MERRRDRALKDQLKIGAHTMVVREQIQIAMKRINNLGLNINGRINRFWIQNYYLYNNW